MFTAPKFWLDGAKPGEMIVRLTDVVAVNVPDVPVTVTLYVPAGAELPAVSASTLIPVVGFGVNTAVTPPGKLDAARFTLPVNPPEPVTEIVELLELP